MLAHTHFTVVIIHLYCKATWFIKHVAVCNISESRGWLGLIAWCSGRTWPLRSWLLNCETRWSIVCWYLCNIMAEMTGGKFAVNPQRPVIWIRCDSIPKVWYGTTMFERVTTTRGGRYDKKHHQMIFIFCTVYTVVSISCFMDILAIFTSKILSFQVFTLMDYPKTL